MLIHEIGKHAKAQVHLLITDMRNTTEKMK